ncbi:unnamed protein product [Thelazia callipaeda]|uniref:Ovule protein n=1 Tax=Thelazia callipaeda TaxID=103827 RepID=A0A158RD52_THECL|nr:unnamed protein product [Thelazia callipaeda]
MLFMKQLIDSRFIPLPIISPHHHMLFMKQLKEIKQQSVPYRDYSSSLLILALGCILAFSLHSLTHSLLSCLSPLLHPCRIHGADRMRCFQAFS